MVGGARERRTRLGSRRAEVKCSLPKSLPETDSKGSISKMRIMQVAQLTEGRGWFVLRRIPWNWISFSAFPRECEEYAQRPLYEAA